MTNTKVSHTYHFGPEIKYSSKIRKKLTTIVINIAANISEEVASELLFGLGVNRL